MTKAALFDFDGTLADSFEAITASTNHVRGAYGLPPLPEDAVRRYVGYGLSHLLRELVPTADPDAAVTLYREHHKTVMISGTRPMPGVARTVPELARRGFRLAVCSNKRVEFTRRLVDALGLAANLPVVLGPEDVENRPKPDPVMLLEACRRLGVSPAETVYVGDMSIDVHTARAAGILVWLVPGGAMEVASAAAAGPDRVLSGFAELLDLLPTPD
jgi:phosphoglycolate phosphatase